MSGPSVRRAKAWRKLLSRVTGSQPLRIRVLLCGILVQTMDGRIETISEGPPRNPFHLGTNSLLGVDTHVIGWDGFRSQPLQSQKLCFWGQPGYPTTPLGSRHPMSLMHSWREWSVSSRFRREHARSEPSDTRLSWCLSILC